MSSLPTRTGLELIVVWWVKIVSANVESCLGLYESCKNLSMSWKTDRIQLEQQQQADNLEIKNLKDSDVDIVVWWLRDLLYFFRPHCHLSKWFSRWLLRTDCRLGRSLWILCPWVTRHHPLPRSPEPPPCTLSSRPRPSPLTAVFTVTKFEVGGFWQAGHTTESIQTFPTS